MAAAPAADALLDPRQGWRFGFRDFVIAGWSPPATTDAEYQVYREAGMNLVMSWRYELPDRALELARKHGLKVMIDTYTPNDKPWGGTAGPYTPHPSHHPATLPELKWLHERYGEHPALAGYLLGDDQGAVPPELVETTRFLHDQAPRLFPWICQNVMSAESLARAGNPIQDPQIYPTLYEKDTPAATQARSLCAQLAQLRAGCRKFGLVPWPMFNVCDVVSDSLVRLQVYASLAYGAQGIWYFTYRDFGGMSAPPAGKRCETVEEARKSLAPAWAGAAEANQRVAAWGGRLLGRTAAGIFCTRHPRISGGAGPGKSALIESMSDDLLVGVLTEAGKDPLAMVVDMRVDKTAGAVAEREVEVRFAPAVTGIEVVEPAAPRKIAGRTVKLLLPGGGGQLVALTGKDVGALCEGIEAQSQRPARRPVRKDGLFVWLKFDEGQGAVARDASGSGNDAELDGVKGITGRFGKAIRLEGHGSCARVFDAFVPATEAMTISAWIRPTYPATGYGPLVYVGMAAGGVDRFEMGLGPDNLYPVLSDHFAHSGPQLYVSGMKTLIPEGTWGHVAVAAGPSGATTYVNGKPLIHSDFVGKLDWPAPDINIGVRGNEYYVGDIDEVKVWNRCLSAEEIAALASE
jgi:hypothetical protein